MSADFHMTYEQRGDNLHVRAMGVFDGGSACALHDLLLKQYRGDGRVMIDTAGLHEVRPAGGDAFRARMEGCVIPARQLLFKGEKGFELAPEGSRVILMSRPKCARGEGHVCHCVTPCANCTCGKKGPRGAHRHAH